MMPRSFMNNEAKWFPEGTLKDIPDVEADPERYKVLGWALEPGDAVFFHMLTLHGAGAWLAETAGGSCLSASWATIPRSPRGHGGHRHPSPGWKRTWTRGLP